MPIRSARVTGTLKPLETAQREVAALDEPNHVAASPFLVSTELVKLGVHAIMTLYRSTDLKKDETASTDHAVEKIATKYKSMSKERACSIIKACGSSR